VRSVPLLMSDAEATAAMVREALDVVGLATWASAATGGRGV
jgi:DNA primase